MRSDLRTPQLLKQSREVLGLKARQAARQIGASSSVYGKYERGVSPVPAWRVKMLADTLAINRIELVNAMASDYKLRVFKQIGES